MVYVKYLASSMENFESLAKCRKLLKAVLLLGLVGLFSWTYFTPQEKGQREIVEHRNTNFIINQEATFEMSSTYGHGSNWFLNASLKTRSSNNYCRIRNCAILCSSIPMGHDPGEIVSNLIASEYTVACGTTLSINLSFDNCKFPSNKLQGKWLKTDRSISELTLKKCFLSTIDDDAFNTAGFQKTTRITLIDNEIWSLSYKIFNPLLSLRELTVRSNIIKQADFDLLRHVADTLTVLELIEAIEDVKVLRNITGGSTKLKVQVLSLNDNIINTIDKTTFAGVPKVISLYIERSNVQTILLEAFDSMIDTILQIIISSNNIVSLPNGIFDPILESGRSIVVTIKDNPWHCDCKLKWLKEFIMNHRNIISIFPVCKTPKENALKTFDEANFCNESQPQVSSTVYDETTGGNDKNDSTDKPTTNEIVRLPCDFSTNFLYTYKRKLLSVDLEIPARLSGFCASQEHKGVLVYLPDLNTDISLLWFDNEDVDNSLSCRKNVKNVYLIQNIEEQKVYTICLLVGEKITTSPLNCLAVDTYSHNVTKDWLTNDIKLIVFSAFSVSLIFVSLVSALFVYFLIRRHPTLLRGSKRVVVVKRRKVDAIVLPKGVDIEKEEQEASNNSIFNTLQGDGYVTPLPPVAPPIRRGISVSRMSFQSDGNSYVSEIEPTPMQLVSWRLKFLRCSLKKENRDPPPLPPQRPTVPSLSLEVNSKERPEYCPCTV